MKAKLLLLPLLIATAVNADVLTPTEDGANYADKRVRYTAKLQAPPKVAANDARQKYDISKHPSTPNLSGDAVSSGLSDDAGQPQRVRTTADLPLRELSESIEVSFRDRSLASSIRTLTPPGWVVDMQLNTNIEKTMVSFSGETTYAQALKDILEPQGLTFLAYRNMKPKPLLVVTHGGKK